MIVEGFLEMWYWSFVLEVESMFYKQQDYIYMYVRRWGAEWFKGIQGQGDGISKAEKAWDNIKC